MDKYNALSCIAAILGIIAFGIGSLTKLDVIVFIGIVLAGIGIAMFAGLTLFMCFAVLFDL